MLFLSNVALLTMVQCGSLFVAATGLSLRVTAPKTLSGVEKFQVTATLTNNGENTLVLLNDPRSILHPAPTDSFSLSHSETGMAPSFHGIMVKYIPHVAAKMGSSGSIDLWTTLHPGESVSVNHDLSTMYNFTASGRGTYTLTPSNELHHLSPSSPEPVPILAEAQAVSIVILGDTGSLAKGRPEEKVNSLERRTKYVGCGVDGKEEIIDDAVDAAQDYQAHALEYLEDHDKSTRRYVKWFGNFTNPLHKTATSHYFKMGHMGAYDTYTYDCTCPLAPGAYAYVYRDRFAYVYLCSAFWEAPLTGIDSRAGTIIHESSHFAVTANTDDHVYGQYGAMELARYNATMALQNADNHEYFAENNPYEK